MLITQKKNQLFAKYTQNMQKHAQLNFRFLLPLL
jgi:hypothetical protein